MLTILLPFFNEEGWIGQTIDSLVLQSDQRFRLILIDNGSTDVGAREARDHAVPLGNRAELIACPRPGKIHAMATGLARTGTPLVAICDADTRYPPAYVDRIIRLFARWPDAAAVMALDLYASLNSPQSRDRISFLMRKVRRFRGKCHAGGYAQAFRTDLLRAAGGFDAARWPYVLEDHEIAHRMMALGPAVYDPIHVCYPSSRRACRTSVSWDRTERLLYRYLPQRLLDWYFYSFLGPRLAARNALGPALRHKDWPSARS